MTIDIKPLSFIVLIGRFLCPLEYLSDAVVDRQVVGQIPCIKPIENLLNI